MSDELDPIAKIVDSEVARRLYDDALANAAKETGGGLTEIVKGLKLFTLPFIAMANFRERILHAFESCRQRVPEERQVESPPEIAGPIIEALRFLDDKNPLRAAFLNLLTASIDSERQKDAHPAFVTILSQLSRDEAVLLKQIAEVSGKAGDEFEVRMKWVANPQYGYNRYEEDENDFSVNAEVSSPHFRPTRFAFPDRLHAYMLHLESLSLIQSKNPNREIVSGQETRMVSINAFGLLFTTVCLG